MAECVQRHAQGTAANMPELCKLDPRAFVDQVINGGKAVDDGDWVQPQFRRKDGVWQLHSFEVLYRMTSAFGVPFPAFVDFVHAASDQCPETDVQLRRAFRRHAVSSIRRVDSRLSQLGGARRAAMQKAGLLTYVNFTAKQLDAILTVPLENGKLLAVEETEYDAAPKDLSSVRHELWQRLGALSLDDAKPTMAEVMSYAEESFDYEPPRTPAGKPYKPLPPTYNHDFAFARGFIADFRRARRSNPAAKADLKLDEEFCCYLVGVGHAPFSRQAMAQWCQEHPIASRAARKAGLELIREALGAGMGICLEVSFDDDDVEWLHAELPELEGRLSKQGGQSGPAALPHSLVDAELFSRRIGQCQHKDLRLSQATGQQPEEGSELEAWDEAWAGEQAFSDRQLSL